MDQAAPRIIAAIESAWAALREEHPELPQVTAVVDTRGARHNLAYPEGRIVGDEQRPELPVPLETVKAGARPMLEAILHVATHALCAAREFGETSNRGQRHNRHFRAVAAELGMIWPKGEPPHPVRGFSPVPLPEDALERYRPLLAQLETLVGDAEQMEATGEVPIVGPVGASGRRLSLECSCTPVRTLQIGRRVLEQGPVICGVCGEMFRER